MRPATPLICAFIDENQQRYRFSPICRALAVHGIRIAPRTYWAQRSAAPSKRALWDTTITEILAGIYQPEPRVNTGIAVRHLAARDAQVEICSFVWD